MAIAALMKELARIERHLFQRGMPALRTGQHGFEYDGRRCHDFRAPSCTAERKPAFVAGFTSAEGFVLPPSYFTLAVFG